MNHNSDFIKLIEGFRDRHNMSDTGVSRFLAKNPNFLDRLRNGHDVYSKTEKRIRNKMVNHDATTGVIV